LVEQTSVFGRKWNVNMGLPVYGELNLSEGEKVLSEKLLEHLSRDGMCLFNLNSAASAIIKHNDCIVVVDCGTRGAPGLASSFGTSVAVFNTCPNDLMFYIRNLNNSLNAQKFSITSLSVKAAEVNSETARVIDGDMGCVRGTFSQGDQRFKYAGLQCMAVSLEGIAKHTIDSVFTWQTDNLDKVVVLGDNLYTSLRDQQGIRGGYRLLSVPDLPKETIIDGQRFLFQYSDFVSGDVDVVEGDLIDEGVHTTLKYGLERMYSNYDTCFLTMNGGTCAIIGQGGHYAVVDSHARSASGMSDGEGRSVVLYFRGLEHVFQYIWTFAAFLKKSQKQFEIAGVRVTHIGPIESSNLSLGPGVTPKTTETDLGCSSAIQSTLGSTNIQMGAKHNIPKGSSESQKQFEIAGV